MSDQKRIEQMSIAIMIVIRENYLCGPLTRDRVFEALDTLAVCAAAVVKGCHDSEAEPLEFFSRRLNAHLNNETPKNIGS